ncbi:alpha/beta fold hydrolase [Dactylosporangium sp. CA-052675]|uniref:alpha/beta fold hydrolase n=1 Tax=Dactylosporangium sp. CA-052675 TaxID=3239927 RepID=UPI003D947D43
MPLIDVGGVRLYVPCLVVGFADDLIAAAALGRQVATAIPRARYGEIPDAGHHGYLEQPGRVNAELFQFLSAKETA